MPVIPSVPRLRVSVRVDAPVRGDGDHVLYWKILEWSPSPEEALAAMFRLNDRYALDGRDPNSSSGIAWCLGRYDRPWGPRRPFFGSVRYMSSDAAVRKLQIAGYLRCLAAGSPRGAKIRSVAGHGPALRKYGE